MAEPPFDIEVTDALLSTTRSVRKRLDLEKPVPNAVITRCIELSTQAPTGSNEQNWRWMVVTDGDKRARLADIYRKGASDYLAVRNRKHFASTSAQNARVFDSARYLLEILDRVPVHVLPCIKLAERPSSDSIASWASIMGSIMPAIWSFNLALRARGLGTVLTTLHLEHANEAAALLGIPDNIVQVGLLPVAYTVGTQFRPANRTPVEAITHWEQW